ncbi:hypothetical protein K491DRAFT_601295 [Lophiostoma macrostomum CBS 122681]|uniref:RFX-type winged-helix domain-containing protein n=1 Tax=Lophiostoma macrostomum CBS 122681 TaxID=1314788 RepID=A0A6A6T5P9_9PLEO|nr:hypothetical protein K491DRAFT_601295 [Lophiostoma macrostomum CBS 122681]
MAHDIRSRSNTSISTKSNRPLSRASTTSFQSFDQHDQSHHVPVQFHALPQSNNNNLAPSYNDAPLEPALIQAAHHASQQEAIDMDAMQRLMQYSGESAHIPAPPNNMPAAQFFDPNHAHHMHASLSQQPQPVSVPVEVDEKKKKGSASGSATNDKELREMLVRNEGRQLNDVAAEVIATDRTSKAEKSKQLFAMLWLKSVCKTAKTSVPRNRVYSRYAERCGTERVIPLNPASFGKLVRVIFPGIQTRRLGVRTQSKYHYVDLALLYDDEDGEESRRLGTGHSQQPGLQRQGSAGPKIDFKSMPRLTADTAAFPTQDQAFESQSSFFSQGTSKGRLFTDIYSDGYRSRIGRQTSNSYEYELKFATTEQMAPEENAAIVLPDISPYLPPRTDPDAAEALVALYRTHCTSLVDSVRYCKEKQFFRLYASFHGTLTVPVQKLFAQQEIAPWIRECDWMMYQKMIRNVSQLTLQVAPAQVLKFLDSVEKRLREHLCKVFNSLPMHVLEARLEPATLFTHLLRQMLRVNSTAHAAAVMIMGDQNRDTMYDEFTRLVNFKRIIENELPQSCGHEEVYNILKIEIRTLLLPLNIGGYAPDGTYICQPAEENAEHTNETVIDRIASFLTKLPSRFPHVPARTILHCVNALGSAILREITIENGQSFQGWWLTKVFVDELGHWLASLGGFLDHSPSDWSALSYSPVLMGDGLNTNMTNGGSGSNNESRYSSIDVEYAPDQSFVSNGNGYMQSAGDSKLGSISRRHTQQYDQVSFNLDLDLATSQQEPGLDDSAIAMMETDKISDGVQLLRSHFPAMTTGVS